MFNKKDNTSERRVNKIRGFTLIEMVIAVAILAIVSGAILVSISGQRDKAQATQMLTEMSGTFQPIMMCLSDDGSVTNPETEEGNDICNEGTGYGQWPETGSAFSGYDLVGDGFSDLSNGWCFCTESTGGSFKICCDSAWDKCKKGSTSEVNCDSN
ncbi:MAG: type II secretion system protein [Candidatus Moranbacteria bacterium]|nr:type II secretion system protein [Candidatus Moranbacteria bacterium]